MSKPRKRDIDWSQYFSYANGELFWIANTGTKNRVGTRAGRVIHDGYREIRLLGGYYREHRVIYEILNGEIPDGMLIDHVNGIRTDNRIENLRLVDTLGNTRNNAKSAKNKTGHVGVSWCKAVGKWRAQIGVNNRQVWIGSFDDFDQAVAARKAAELAHGFHVNHGRAA
ncbi:MAG: HNH endonuclease [Pseudomonas umsongensis]|nr:HNH endonuclease [Pseudomonas umsongensis]